MKSIPQRQSLVSQTVTLLREELGRGTWIDWLPGERALCETLQVSRNTLRAALVQLKREGLIRSDHGSGNRIMTKPTRRAVSARSHEVGLLSPEAIERLRPSQTLWIDELRAMLGERDCRLHVFHGPQYFRANPAASLEKLVSQHPHGCWILMLSNEHTQRWFAQSRVPAIVAGSVYDGIGLPFRDLDHRAMCRHAAGVLLGAGHRKIALLVAKSQFAGDLESEDGFRDGVKQCAHEDAVAVVARHDGSTQGIVRTVRRLVEGEGAVSAMLVANAYHYLAVVSCLAQLGRRVSQDISMISRDEDLFLSFLVPTPARYVVNAHSMAKALAKPVLELLENGVVTQRSAKLMPTFIRGDSISAPRG